ncbi:hypothetical protein BKI52_29585 [marine bacterium AO1-C]|nr:hypothetical protein BKI52_29585 [marine bacterium AO1-C]
MVPYPRQEVMEKATLLLEQTPPHMKGVIANDLVILNIVGEEVHYWSPRLTFRVEEDEDDETHTKVAGLIGPRPPVWTLFMFIYFFVGTVGFFISTFALSKILMGQKSLLIAAFPITIVFLLTAYFAGKYGEKLAKDQMEILKGFVREVISFDEKVDNHLEAEHSPD